MKPVNAILLSPFFLFLCLQPNAALLGHRHSHADATSEAPPADGFCCHYATVAADACNTCMAPSTTGHCAIAAANCSSCGGQWCLPPTPAPTTVDFVAPPAPTPGICCHYALDADDICGTCKAPDNGNCGKDAGKDICVSASGAHVHLIYLFLQIIVFARYR